MIHCVFQVIFGTGDTLRVVTVSDDALCVSGDIWDRGYVACGDCIWWCTVCFQVIFGTGDTLRVVTVSDAWLCFQVIFGTGDTLRVVTVSDDALCVFRWYLGQGYIACGDCIWWYTVCFQVIFGTGDTLRVMTVSANYGFVRAVSQQGIQLAVHLHSGRILIEQKTSQQASRPTGVTNKWLKVSTEFTTWIWSIFFNLCLTHTKF